MNKNNLKKSILILAMVTSLTACKQKAEMGEMKVPQQNKTEQTEQLSKPEDQADKLKQALSNNGFNINKDILASDQDLAKKVSVPIVDKINKYSDVVKLPGNIGQVIKKDNASVKISDEQAVIIAKLKKQAVTLEDGKAACEWGDSVFIKTKSQDMNTGEDMSYVDIDGSKVQLGNEDVSDKLEKEIIGMKTGETKKTKITYPKDYYNEELAGRTVVSYVKVLSISRPGEPTKEEIKLAKAEAETMKSYSLEENALGQIKQQLNEQSKITAYPKEVIESLRKEYREKYLGEENIKAIEKNIKTEEDAKEIKEAEDLYVLNNIEDRLVFLALVEKTGLTKDSEYVKKYMEENYIDEITDDGLYSIILEKLTKK